MKLVPDGDAVLDWDDRVLVYTPRYITSPQGVVEPGWYYLNAPGLTRNDFAFADKAKSIIEDTALTTLGGIAAGALVGQPWVGPALGAYTFTQRIRDNPILSEMADVGFPGVRKPSEEARLARLAELAAEREQRRVAMLQSIATAAQQIDRTGSGYERNRALVELQDAIKDYTLFYGSDPAAMAAVQPYQQALGQLWEGGQAQQPGLMTVPEGGYTGVDITVPPVLDDNYDRFRANPTQQSAPDVAEPTVTPEQYFSRAYQAAASFRAANVSDAPVFTDPRVRAPYTGVEVAAPTLRDNAADRFRADTPTTPSTGLGQSTSALGSGAYSAMLPTFDFSQPLGVGSIPPIAPVLPSVRQSSASVGTPTPPTFASSPLAQTAMGVPSPLAQYGEAQQSTTPSFGYVTVTPLQFGATPPTASRMAGTGLGAGVPATPPTFAWSPLAQPSLFDPPTRVAAKGNTGNAGRWAGKRVTASSNPIGGLRDSDPMDVWVKNRTRQVEAKNAIPPATPTKRATTKFAPVTALPNDKNTPDEWVTRRYAELARKTAWA